MQLETERLLLREFTLDDFPFFASLMADPEVMRFSLSGPIFDTQKARDLFQKRILDHYRQYGHGLYATFYKPDNTFIGGIGLMTQYIDERSQVELGYRLLPQYWGKGLASEGCLAVCHYAFNELAMEQLIAIIGLTNTRSIAVAKRIGMRYTKEALFHNIPVQIYSLKACLS